MWFTKGGGEEQQNKRQSSHPFSPSGTLQGIDLQPIHISGMLEWNILSPSRFPEFSKRQNSVKNHGKGSDHNYYHYLLSEPSEWCYCQGISGHISIHARLGSHILIDQQWHHGCIHFGRVKCWMVLENFLRSFSLVSGGSKCLPEWFVAKSP